MSFPLPLKYNLSTTEYFQVLFRVVKNSWTSLFRCLFSWIGFVLLLLQIGTDSRFSHEPWFITENLYNSKSSLNASLLALRRNSTVEPATSKTHQNQRNPVSRPSLLVSQVVCLGMKIQKKGIFLPLVIGPYYNQSVVITVHNHKRPWLFSKILKFRSTGFRSERNYGNDQRPTEPKKSSEQVCGPSLSVSLGCCV